MSRFFIDRPIFAWVIALFIAATGALSLTQLPIQQYPAVAPPAIQIATAFPGASAQTLEDSVLAIIEREMHGSPGLMYMESVAQADGSGSLTLSFEQGSDVRMAQVDVQNRLNRALPRLPASVVQQGVRVEEVNNNFLLFMMLSSSDAQPDLYALGDQAARTVVPALQRVPGVGRVLLFGSEQALRVWFDPVRLQSLGLSSADVLSAIRSQNLQVAAGEIGALPSVAGQSMVATVRVDGQLSSVAAFENLLLRANPDGSTVRLRDVARVELGGQLYATSARLNGQPALGIGIQLAADGNALATAQAVRAELARLEPHLGAGIQWTIPYDTSRFVALSVQQVVLSLALALLLVVAVIFLFLQSWRYTLIPAIVVPITLLGAMTGLLALGYSINVLTLFAMVLVIGIVVDDSIVVVENVERLMREEGLAARQAAIKAMKQISGAIIGTTAVLLSVFVPLAFFDGAMGNILRQFAVVLALSVSLSTFLALTLAPALCTLVLKQALPQHGAQRGFFGAFNRRFDAGTQRYLVALGWILRRPGRTMLVYALLIALALLAYQRLPASFLPNEDQGSLLVNVQLPPGASKERTQAVMQQVEQFMLAQPEVESVVGVLGFSFSGQGQNAALAFVTLTDWSERSAPESSAQALAGRAFMALSGVRDAVIFPLSPPPIPELGSASGFAFRLQDRSGQGHDALLAARNQLLGLAAQSPVLAQVFPDGLEPAPQLQVDIDRERAAALGVGFEQIGQTLGLALGSAYVNDFPNQGRLQRVIIMADAPARMTPDDVLRLTVPNRLGQAVPLSSFASTRWVQGPTQTVRYNGFPAMRINGQAAEGMSSGAAMAEMARLAQQLPPGFGFEWTGQSLEEERAGAQFLVVLGFVLLAVYLCLAALYGSWKLPLAVLLVVPLGAVGLLLALLWRGFEADIYFQIAMVTIVGLSAKNAILIVEFAKTLQTQGRSAMEAALVAARLRLRAIVMVSTAFIAGVTPLMLASGAGALSQQVIGTALFGGMVSAVVLGVLLVPLFYVLVRTLGEPRAGASNRATSLGAGHE